MTDVHQYSEHSDGSVCVRHEPGDPWKVIEGGEGGGASLAHKFANQQNRFWKPWVKESIIRHGNRHDEDDDTFSRRIKRPK